MKMPLRWIGMPLVALVAACADTGETDLGVDDALDEVPGAEEVATTPAPPPAMEQPPMAETVQIEPLQDSGASGEATVTAEGDQTQVMVRLAGLPANSTHPGHIHSGTCDAVGSVVQPLQEIAVDATGTGTMTATVEVPPMTAMDGQHIVVYHGEGGTPIACAAIPAHSM